MDGFRIGPDSIACGLAFYTGQPVITPDVLEDPRWGPWLWLAEQYELRAVWSFPIETVARRVVGTLAMYFGAPREATPRDHELAAFLTQTAAMIIAHCQGARERARAEALLRREEEQRILIHELHHRTRNLLGVVSSIAEQTLATCGSLEAFGPQFDRRLGALGRVQNLLSREVVPNITIDELVGMELAAHGVDLGVPDRVSVRGPSVTLPERALQMLALALHELTTNALKHGALHDGAGRLDVGWAVRDDGAGERRLQLDWVERGVAMPAGAAAAPRRGFGLDLLEVMLPYELLGETRVRFGPEGVHCSIELPLEQSAGG